MGSGLAVCAGLGDETATQERADDAVDGRA